MARSGVSEGRASEGAGGGAASGGAEAPRRGLAARVVAFYVDGFRSMDVGRTLWLVILVKVVVLTLIATLLLPSLRRHEFSSDREQTEHVLDRLTQEVAK